MIAITSIVPLIARPEFVRQSVGDSYQDSHHQFTSPSHPRKKTEGNRVNMNCETDHFKNRELLVDRCFVDVYIIYNNVEDEVYWILDCITFVTLFFLRICFLHTIPSIPVLTIYMETPKENTKNPQRPGRKPFVAADSACCSGVVHWFRRPFIQGTIWICFGWSQRWIGGGLETSTGLMEEICNMPL